MYQRIVRSLVVLPVLALAACGGESSPAQSTGAGGAGTTTATGGGGGGGGGGAGTGGAGGGQGGAGGAAPVDACAGAAALRGTCQDFPATIGASTTLAKGCYHVAKNPDVADGVTLTIAPGTTILFAEGTGLDFSGAQALHAVGTADEPICFSGDTAARGAWKGLVFGRTEGDADVLDHVTVEYAGSTKVDPEGAGIKSLSDSRAVALSVSHTTVRESEGYGLYLVASTEAAAFEANTFTKNGRGPASVDSDVTGLLDAASRFTGNDVDEIVVRANRVQKNATWHVTSVPYHLDGNLHVDVPFTIDAPATLVFGPEAWISVGGDDAALHAVGTEAAPIVFTGEQPVRGYWDGLVFDGTNHAANALEHVVVEYAGNTLHDAAGAGVRAIADSHGVTLAMASTTVHECQGYGLFLAGSAVLPGFAGNTFTKNGLGPANVGSLAVHQLDTASSYTDNDLDHVHVRDGNIDADVTWLDLGVPFELEASVNVGAVWTLAPGVTLLMAKDRWIHVGSDDAGFHAVGTAQKPVTISGIEKTAGYWHSIVYGKTLNGANAIEHATVEYGGSPGGGGEKGMIQAYTDSHGVVVSVRDSVIQHSAQYGIWLGGSAQYNDDIESSNTFADNASGDVFKE
jgi:hypothetical protein